MRIFIYHLHAICYGSDDCFLVSLYSTFGEFMVHHATTPVVLVVGTRPEGIKLVPLYFAFKSAQIPVVLCSTVQHAELLTEVFDLFGVEPDVSLNIMRPGQDLFYVTQSVLQKTKEFFVSVKPSLVIVQGDTTSGMAAGLAAFYLKIPLAHVEAGLRTGDVHAPFPEEMNRRVLRVLSSYHFAPTSWAAAQLLAEGVQKSNIFCVGNTVVDALRLITHTIDSGALSIEPMLKKQLEEVQAQGKKIMLLTMHRRESFDGGVQRVLHALCEWLKDHPEVFCVYPYHPNPQVVNVLHEVGFARLDNALLLEPIAYKEMVYVLNKATLVVTDSGGIQEEAVSLGKSVLVLREKTERIEAVWADVAQLVGTDTQKLVDALNHCIESPVVHAHTAQLFGDGFAAEKIVHILKDAVHLSAEPGHSLDTILNVTKKRDMAMKKVASVIGLGYIGLPTSIVLAESGYQVIGVDVDEQKVAAINAGDPVIKEAELFEKLQVALGAGTFTATTSVQPSDYFIIAVPTPLASDKTADLSYVFSAADSIATVLKKGDVVILESTVPVGATQELAECLAEHTGLSVGVDFFVAHCPERVLPGNIFHELVHNARIIGGIDEQSMQRAKELYEAFVVGELYLTNAKMAELIKLVENSSRDAQIAFAHQVASMATSLGLDPYEVVELANKHPRVNILNPSCGVGGHCLAVDPWFLVQTFDREAQLLKVVREINDARPQELVTQITDAAQLWQREHNKAPVIALCGMTYKPDVDDIRESPALVIARELSMYSPLICEPQVQKEQLQAHIKNGEIVKTADAIARADIVVFLVAHKRFKAIDRSCLNGKKIFDFCGLMHEPKSGDQQQAYYFWPARAHGPIEMKTENKANEIVQKGGLE